MTARELGRKLLREPLLHFLLAGLVLFLLAGWYRRETDHYRIVVTPERVAQLGTSYEAEFGSPPPPAMLPRLIDDYVASEVLFREGVARGLDENDEIVRRRIIQKVEFLEQDLAAPAEPDEAQLREWYDGNAAQYAEPGRIAFSHIFFATDASSEASVRRRAEAALVGLAPETLRAPELGDSFPDLYDFSGFGSDEARRLFGNSGIARNLFAAPLGKWSGPLRSAYGWHLVRVSSAQQGGRRPFDAVRGQVRENFVARAREEANRQRLAALRSRYTVVRQD